MTVNEQRIEGEFRYVNSRIITHCEEIAFYGGHSREELNINESFNKLTNHYRNFIFFRFSMGFIDNIIAKCNFAIHHWHSHWHRQTFIPKKNLVFGMVMDTRISRSLITNKTQKSQTQPKKISVVWKFFLENTKKIRICEIFRLLKFLGLGLFVPNPNTNFFSIYFF